VTQMNGVYCTWAPVISTDALLCLVQMVYRPDRFLRGGDHLSFIDQGYPAVRFTEPHENFAHQHQVHFFIDFIINWSFILRRRTCVSSTACSSATLRNSATSNSTPVLRESTASRCGRLHRPRGHRRASP
jgi:hypothetical protein